MFVRAAASSRGRARDWDARDGAPDRIRLGPRQAITNVAKHKVSFEEAMTIFADPLALTRPDENDDEERWITIGASRDQSLLVVVHTHVDIGPDLAHIRIISARKPTRRERRQYEQDLPQD